MSSHALTVYIDSDQDASDQILAQVEQLRELYVPPGCEVEIVDVAEDRTGVLENGVMAVPTIEYQVDGKIRRVVGTIADIQQLVEALCLESDTSKAEPE
jgi:hypothetical protein